MRREIRFKGRSVEDGKWVSGYYVHLHDCRKKRDSYRIYTGFAETDVDDFFGDWYEVNPETVFEFTRCYDMAGEPIYEGDIVEKQDYPNLGRKRTIIRIDGGGFITNEPSGKAIESVLVTRMSKNWAVIGNIIESPGIGTED